MGITQAMHGVGGGLSSAACQQIAINQFAKRGSPLLLPAYWKED
jgi:hypothetical protein